MTTPLHAIFAKPIDRPIDGVIKADDEASLRVELEEYVITAEIEQRLEQFLDAYNNYTSANGVWISGFFGSGKSHLLKMLALLLENRHIDGVQAFDLFKEKLIGKPMLEGALRKAVSIRSRSILFNIDQKADVISKTDVDALLAVFQKVFDEMCGYYGKQPHVAQFERDLDERGLLSTFRAEFQELSGKPWERGREQALLEKTNIAKAFAMATGGNATETGDILGQYRRDTRISIEDFANNVKAWVDKRGPKFRLNFFVDEVGQYIADNVKLMTNLQTIAETLNTRCRGQAWLIVTAQQDMESVIGDRTVQQQNDFSKIQARFANRMPLNSADVAEVIQRRLLVKTDDGHTLLGLQYDREENNLRTLFDFTDGSMRFKSFQSRQHFINSYPFPPYQYVLFQRAITSLSEHNAFEGKHSSVGERSMLGVFQEVAKKLTDMPVGQFATFDLMFDGIETALKSAAHQSIQIAKKQVEQIDPFAVRVLKALFLVKYVKEFKATVRNIAILLLGDLDADMAAQRRQIEAALNTLESATLIQRNGEMYEFLTNEEKDVEAEIKSLEVDQSELTRLLEELAFDGLIKLRKIRHATTGTEYPYARKLDDQLLGRDYELSVNIISPLSGDTNSAEALRLQSMQREELVVALEPDIRFVRDLGLYRQTDKFVRQARTGTHQPGRDRIVSEKGEQNSRRYKDLELRLRRLLAEARLFVRGDELEIGGEDPQERIVRAFQTLVDKVYVSLPVLRGAVYTEADIAKAANAERSLLTGDTAGLTEAEQDVLNHVQGQARIGVKVSVKALKERFSTRPYGWPDPAILTMVAALVSKGKLEARSDSTPLEGKALASALGNNAVLANVLLTPQVEFTPAQIRKSKDLYKELFDIPSDSSDARTLAGDWAKGLEKLAAELDRLLAQRGQYPFVTALDPLAALVRTARGQQPAWFITDLPAHAEALLDAKDDQLDPIRRFMTGPLRDIYDGVRDFLRAQDANLIYVDAAKAASLRSGIDDPTCYKGPALQALKTIHYDLKAAVELRLSAERRDVAAAVEEVLAKLAGVPDFARLTAEQQADIIRHGQKHRQGVESIAFIGTLRDRAAGVRRDLLQTLLMEVDRHTAPPPPPAIPARTKAATPAITDRDFPEAPEPTATVVMDSMGRPVHKPGPQIDAYARAFEVKVSSPLHVLTTTQDVDVYIEALRTSLLAEIAKGKKVIV